MKIKRFVAHDMRQALRLVRESLGQDAVILRSQRHADGMELVAAADFDAELVNHVARQVGYEEPVANRSKENNQSEDHSNSRSMAEQAGEGQSLSQLQHELQSMRELLEGHLSGLAWQELNKKHPQQAMLVRKFKNMGIGLNLARRIAEGVPVLDEPELAWRTALHSLARHMRFADDQIIEQGGVYALVGPTGVGKTTALAKLATRHVIRHGRKQIALISMDDYRIGARSQLTTYGQLLNVPVFHAGDVSELKSLLERLDDKHLILIDTPGVSPRDKRLETELSGLQAIMDMRTCLVLSANTDRKVMQRTVERYSRIPLHGVILNKLDEAESLGGALTCVIDSDLTLLYLGVGQHVTEDLEPARGQNIIEFATSMSSRTESHPSGNVGPGNRKSSTRKNTYVG